MSRSGYNRRRYDPDSSGNATNNTCWYTTSTGNTMVASTKTYTSNATIYAQWYTNGTGSISASPTSTTYGGSTTITYSRAGGENNAISS